MFCYQCEQTAKGTGCTVLGVCGKQPEVAALQDLLLYTLMGLSQVAVEGRKVGVSDSDVNIFTVKAAFSTLTNVDFDPERFLALIREAAEQARKAQGESAGGRGAIRFQRRRDVGSRGHARSAGEAGRGLRPEILPRGQPRHPLPQAHGAVRHQGGQRLRRSRPDPGAGGRVGLRVRARGAGRHSAHGPGPERLGRHGAASAGRRPSRPWNCSTRATRAPTATPSRPRCRSATRRARPSWSPATTCRTLRRCSNRPRARASMIYTHGEMLPTHGYPALKKYTHFYGHYGTAWQNQNREFPEFPGRHPDDHQLHPATEGRIQGPTVHQRHGRLAGHPAHHGR